MVVVSKPVPIVDFSRLIKGEKDEQSSEIIHKACCDSGFFYLSNFGIGPEEMAALKKAMVWFFALPTNAKQAVARSEENSRGYYNNELTKNIRDMKEVFDFGFKNIPNLSDNHLKNHTQDGWNQWPEGEDSETFKRVLIDYYDCCHLVASRLLEVLMGNLGAPIETLKEDFHPQHSSFLRLNYYPVEDPLVADIDASDTGNMGVHHHTDAGALTLLMQDNVGGLEVFHKNEWKPVTPLEGTLVVNIGDIVKVWSNDLYHAALHRVVASGLQDRYSAPYFYNPAYTANYQPLSEIRGPRLKPHYSPINWGHFRYHRQHGDYGDYGNEIQITDYLLQQEE